MRYALAKLPIQSLLRPISDAGVVLARLDERISRSPVGQGLIERMHFADACASLWIDGELVHLEDLVLHDATKDIRTPTHELTIARDVLLSRRRMAGHPAAWALSPEGINSLRGQAWPAQALPEASQALTDGAGRALESKDHAPEGKAPAGAGEGVEIDDQGPLAAELAAIDAVLARSETALADVKVPRPARAREKDQLVYDLDWDEDARIEEWRVVLAETEGMPPVLRAIILLDAWNMLQVLEHAPWLGRLLAASVLRQGGIATGAHLVAINLGLRSIAVDRRRHPQRETRLLAIANGLSVAGETGLKEHDRLALARQMMERKLVGRRTSSKLAELLELVMARPLVHATQLTDVKLDCLSFENHKNTPV